MATTRGAAVGPSWRPCCAVATCSACRRPCRIRSPRSCRIAPSSRACSGRASAIRPAARPARSCSARTASRSTRRSPAGCRRLAVLGCRLAAHRDLRAAARPRRPGILRLQRPPRPSRRAVAGRGRGAAVPPHRGKGPSRSGRGAGRLQLRPRLRAAADPAGQQTVHARRRLAQGASRQPGARDLPRLARRLARPAHRLRAGLAGVAARRLRDPARPARRPLAQRPRAGPGGAAAACYWGIALT